jgi:hypothetical protein
MTCVVVGGADPAHVVCVCVCVCVCGAQHICAYMCWLTEGTGDPEVSGARRRHPLTQHTPPPHHHTTPQDRCYFPGDPGEHPFRCTVKNLPTINERFPFLKGTGAWRGVDAIMHLAIGPWLLQTPLASRLLPCHAAGVSSPNNRRLREQA